MCFLCDGGTIEEWLDQTRERIDRYGFTMVMVEGGKSSWTYTIGLTESFGDPELVVTGLDAEHSVFLIDGLAERIKDGERFDSGETSLCGVPLRIGPVHPTQWIHGRFNSWLEFYDDEPRPQPDAVQILWPNDDDVFPPDRDFCDVHRDCQPVLSVLVAHDVHRPVGRERGRRRRKGRR